MNMVLLALAVCCLGVQSLQFISQNKLKFDMNGVDIHSVGDGQVKVELPQFPSDWATVTGTEVGQPSLPSLQNAVILSTGTQKMNHWDWQVVVTNVSYRVQDVRGVVTPSQPGNKRCGNNTATRVGVTYADDNIWYPKQHNIAVLHSFHTFRDVQGALLRINPVQYNPSLNQLRVLEHCEITLVSTSQFTTSVPRNVDMDFNKLYQFIYGNAQHHSMNLLPNDQPGTLLIISEQRFQSQANTFASNVKATGVTVVQHTWDGSSTAAQLKTNVVEPQYKQSLAYLVLFGKKVPYFTVGKGEDRDACDQCYGQLNGGTDQTVDIAVTRISVDATADAQGQIAKFKAYQSTSTEAWNKMALGTATKDAFGDEKNLETDTKILQQAGFKTINIKASPKNKTKAIDVMNSGVAIWEFLGDGSGTEVAQLGFSVKDVSSLKNDGKPFVFFDTACLNAQFQSLHPSLNEALMSHAPGGALATLGGTEEETGPSWTEQQCAFQLIQKKAATRLGPWMTGALMCMYKGQKQEAVFSLTERVVFGDATLTLALLQ